MDLFIFALTCSFFIFGLVDTADTRTVPCNKYEVMVCGDADREWSICKPKTPSVNRILSAQLDTRYANRYCRRYGTPENFGLTSSGRAMWTVGWCFGTFFLCLDLDPDFDIENDSDVKEDLYASSEYDSSTLSDLLSSQTTLTEHTEQITTEAKVVEENTASEVGYKADADEYIADEKTFQSESQQAENCSTNAPGDGESISETNSGLNPRLKFWLIFGIVSGGLIIVILIGVIAYLSMQCFDTNTDEAPVCKSEKSNEKYFRKQKWSTSALVTSESDYCTDVYDFIPANKSKKTTHDTTKCKTHKTNKKKTEDYTCEKENDRMPEEHSERSGSLHNNNTFKRNDYFVLIPHNLSDNSLNCVNNNCQVYAHVTENIYDHLIHSPPDSKPDASTYHHLNFERDTCNTETTVESDQSVNE